MDIDLFSEMVKGLILDNDEVTLPGLGTFVSEVMPSTFSDKGYTINPPYRRLSFRQRGSEDDRLLAEFYSKANGTDSETSGRILSEFITGLRNTLQTKKIVVFPGLGRLRATKENTFFFIADEDLDIYPYGVGLEPVSLKTHEETPDEVAQSVAALRELVDEPVASVGAVTSTGSVTKTEDSVTKTEGSAAETEGLVTDENTVGPAAVVAEPNASVAELVEATDMTGGDDAKESLRQAQRPECETDSHEESTLLEGSMSLLEESGKQSGEEVTEETEVAQRRKKRGWKVAAIVAASVIGVALLALGIFMLLAHVAPGFIDSILYTPEELRIINY